MDVIYDKLKLRRDQNLFSRKVIYPSTNWGIQCKQALKNCCSQSRTTMTLIKQHGPPVSCHCCVVCLLYCSANREDLLLGNIHDVQQLVSETL